MKKILIAFTLLAGLSSAGCSLDHASYPNGITITSINFFKEKAVSDLSVDLNTGKITVSSVKGEINIEAMKAVTEAAVKGAIGGIAP